MIDKDSENLEGMEEIEMFCSILKLVSGETIICDIQTPFEYIDSLKFLWISDPVIIEYYEVNDGSGDYEIGFVKRFFPFNMTIDSENGDYRNDIEINTDHILTGPIMVKSDFVNTQYMMFLDNISNKKEEQEEEQEEQEEIYGKKKPTIH